MNVKRHTFVVNLSFFSLSLSHTSHTNTHTHLEDVVKIKGVDTKDPFQIQRGSVGHLTAVLDADELRRGVDLTNAPLQCGQRLLLDQVDLVH